MILHYWKNLQKTKQLIGFFIFQRKEKEEKKNKNIKGGEVSHFCNLFFFFKKKEASNNFKQLEGKIFVCTKRKVAERKIQVGNKFFFPSSMILCFFIKERKINCFLYFERKPTFYISKKNRVRRKTRTVKDNGDLIWFDSDGSLDCDSRAFVFCFLLNSL